MSWHLLVSSLQLLHVDASIISQMNIIWASWHYMFIEALDCIHTKSGAVMNAGRVVPRWGGTVGAGLTW